MTHYYFLWCGDHFQETEIGDALSDSDAAGANGRQAANEKARQGVRRALGRLGRLFDSTAGINLH